MIESGARTASLPRPEAVAMAVTSTGIGTPQRHGVLTSTHICHRDAFWSVTGGASTDPCDEKYKGLAPADAPETVALAAFVDNLIKSPGMSVQNPYQFILLYYVL
jgi:Zinc carboxypeptidase